MQLLAEASRAVPVSSPVLVADIGGTNARFALAHISSPGASGLVPQLTDVRRYKAADFPAFSDALRRYREDAGPDAARAQQAVFAVATAILGDEVKLTNSPWSFSITDIRRTFGLQKLTVINDFQAIGHAVPRLPAEGLAAVGPAHPGITNTSATPTHAVLGPGTGLGVCLLTTRGGQPLILPSEAGHIGFSPSDDLELEVMRVLLARHGRVSNERLISGPGLAALHDALCVIEGAAAPRLTPEAITAASAAAPEGPESRTLRLFCSIYGSIAGDIVLAFGAWDGAYLVGRLSNLLLPALQDGLFRKGFENKGRFAAALQKVPTLVVTERQVGLLGAGVFAANALGNDGENG
ncbi:MAG TPA: glucokinase [Pedomonas sp.]|uniref:glucokinase n=1 Tax=Pedomonas sp. TaxID=2976421 RepID=UPI002F40B856